MNPLDCKDRLFPDLIHEGREAPMGESEPVSQALYHASWCDTLNDEKTRYERFLKASLQLYRVVDNGSD